MKIQDFKMRVTPEQSKIVQETLFANGYRWKSNCNSVVYINSPNLYLSDGSIQKGNDYREFINEPEPELTFQQFKKKYIDNEFVLPEKWCIKITEDNREIVKDWMVKNINQSYQAFTVGWYYSNQTEDEFNIEVSPFSPIYAEITFNQFKKYVLNMKEDKELIGYKLKDSFASYKKAAEVIIEGTFAVGKNYDLAHAYSLGKLKKAGVLDLWFEPVYKEKYSLPVINGYEGKGLLTADGQCVEYGCAVFRVKELKRLYSRISDVNISNNRTIESIKLNSGVEVTIKQLRQIVEYFDNM